MWGHVFRHRGDSPALWGQNATKPPKYVTLFLQIDCYYWSQTVFFKLTGLLTVCELWMFPGRSHGVETAQMKPESVDY